MDKAVAGRNAVRRSRGGVLIVTWTNKNAVRRVGGKALSKVGAKGKAVGRPRRWGLGLSEGRGKGCEGIRKRSLGQQWRPRMAE